MLSKKEIAAAGERLKSRDADDNDLLYPNEISGPVTAKNQQKIRAVARQPQKQLAVLLGPTAKAEPLFKALQDYYKNDAGEVVASSFSALPKLFETLDKNTDGKLQQDEVMALNDVEPQLDLGHRSRFVRERTEGSKGQSDFFRVDQVRRIEQVGLRGITWNQIVVRRESRRAPNV